MGWWEQALINAYEDTKLSKYLYEAEQLWNNITDQGYREDCDLIVQQNADASKPELEDGFANSLCVRDSAWLYEITGNAKYLGGKTDGKGGALQVADSVMSEMTNHVAGTPAPGTSGSEFFIAGETDPSSGCTAAAGTQKWLSTQGEMVNAYADLSVAARAYCPGISGSSGSRAPTPTSTSGRGRPSWTDWKPTSEDRRSGAPEEAEPVSRLPSPVCPHFLRAFQRDPGLPESQVDAASDP